MPDISKFSGVAIGDVAKVDGLAKASILDINGVTVPSAFTPLLDTYTGAAAGYSVRQLKTGVTVSMRVRRETAGGTGDDDEADVAFDTSLATPTISLDSAISNASAGVTATTLGQFLNVGTVPPYNGGLAFSDPDNLVNTASCFVDTWYDQSGNANDAEQTAFGSQPQIHDGTVNTDLITENGKPALDFDGSNDHFKMLFSSDLAQPGHHFAVAANYTTAGFTLLFSGNNNTSKRQQYEISTSGKWRLYAGSFITAGASVTIGQHLHSVLANGSSSNFYEDATLLASGDAGSFPLDGLTIGARTVNNQYPWLGTLQEYVLYGADQSSNRTAIETNLNDYFSIY